jgi:chromate transporter
MNEAPSASPPIPPSVWEVARAFNKIALESFGGGLSAWSREIVVCERGWMTDQEFLSASTISRVLPGANQVNMAVFVGLKLHGVSGAIAAVLGLITIPGMLVLLVGALYLRFRDVPAVRHFLAGMAAAAVGLTFAVAWRQGKKTLVSAAPVLLAVATLLLAAVFRAPLWLTLLGLGPLGYWWAWRHATG